MTGRANAELEEALKTLCLFVLGSMAGWLQAESLDLEALRVRIESGKALPETLARLNEAVSADHASPELHQLLVDCLWEMERFAEAVDAARIAAEAYPEQVDLLVKLAEALQRRFDRNQMMWMTGKDEYISVLEHALSMDSRHVEAHMRLIGFYANAPAFVGGDLDKAMKWSESLARVDPCRGGMSIAELMVKKDKTGDWRQAFLALESTCPPEKLAYAFGMALQGVGAFDEAAAQFEKGALVNHADCCYQLGRTRLLGEMDMESAVQDFDRFLAVTSCSQHGLIPGAWWRKGQAHEKLGQVSKAMACYDKALELAPEFKEAQADRDRLQKAMQGG